MIEIAPKAAELGIAGGGVRAVNELDVDIAAERWGACGKWASRSVDWQRCGARGATLCAPDAREGQLSG